MRTSFTLFLLLIFYTCSAQVRGIEPVSEKGVIASSLLKGEAGKRKDALVVGISKYSSSRLQLNYAHSDAELFADYLLSTRNFPPDNVFVLTDSLASSGKIYNAIHSLIKVLQEGDELQLYLAGHGDVQNVADFDEAFFLAWDASDSRNYYGAGGTLDLTKLQLYVNNLANKKKVKVSLIMDACHSGFDLYKNGLLKAQENVIEGFDGVYKMLGCASNELSFEADSVKHGLFTWYLVQGLMGLADNPADNKVEMKELQQWVKASVSAATRGKQNPVISAPESDQYIIPVSAQTRSAALTRFKNRKYTSNFAGRGTAAVDNEPSDNDLTYYIRKYNSFLEREQYYHGDSSCLGVIAEVNKLPEVSYKHLLLTSLKSHLAEVLDTKSQLVLNEFLKGKSQLPPPEDFFEAGIASHLTDSLLPADDPRRTNSQVMEAFHKAFSFLRYERFEKYGEAEQLLRKALAIEKRAAYIYLTMSYLMEYQNKLDSAILYANKASELIPTWTQPRNRLGNLYESSYQYQKALSYHYSVLKQDSAFSWSYNNIGVSMLSMDRYAEAEKFFIRSLNKKSDQRDQMSINRDLAISYSNLGLINKDRGLFAQAEACLLKADSIDPTFTNNLRILSDLYKEMKDGKRTEEYLRKAIVANPYDAESYYKLGEFYRYDKHETTADQVADSLLRIAIKLNPYDHHPYTGLGYLHLDNKTDTSSTWFWKGVTASGKSPGSLFDLASYYALIKRYDSAILYMKQALAKNPFYTDAGVELSKYYLAVKNYPEAERTLLQMTKVHALSPLAWYNLGNFYYNTGKASKAMEQYRKTILLDPLYTPGLKGLIITSIETKDAFNARKYFVELQKTGNRDLPVDQLITLVVSTSNNLTSAERYSWLKKFEPVDPGNTSLTLEIAEAAYLNQQDLPAVAMALQKISPTSGRDIYRQVKWMLLIAIENADKKAMKVYAEKLLTGYDNAEPELQAISYIILGYKEEAKKLKSELGSNWKKNYKKNFIKLFSSISTSN